LPLLAPCDSMIEFQKPCQFFDRFGLDSAMSIWCRRLHRV